MDLMWPLVRIVVVVVGTMFFAKTLFDDDAEFELKKKKLKRQINDVFKRK